MTFHEFVRRSSQLFAASPLHYQALEDPMRKTSNPNYQIRALDRALDILEVFTDQLIFGALGGGVYNDKTKTAKLGRIIQKQYDKGPGWALEDATDEDTAAISVWAKDAIKEDAGTFSMIDPNEKPFV